MTQKLEFRFHIKSPDTYQDFTVPLGTTLIGREPTSGLPLVYPLVSRRHAQLVCTEDECTITDLGSANGTIVNDLKLEPNIPVKLADRSLIVIGPFEITCEAVTIQEEAPQPAVTSEMPIVQAPEPVPPVEVQAPPAEPPGEAPAEVQAEAPVPQAEQAAPPPEKPAAGGRKRQPKAASEAPVEAQPPAPPAPPEPPPPVAKEPVPPASEPEPPKKDTIPPGLSIQSLHLINYLPGIYQNDFMSRFLGLFESILTPVEWNIDNFDLFLDPETSPFGFLSWLANWYEIVYDSSWGEAQRRTLLEEAHLIYARRGTRWALTHILEIYLGQKPEILESGSAGGPSSSEPFTFFVKLPSGNKNINMDLVERLIDSNKPAQTTYRLM